MNPPLADPLMRFRSHSLTDQDQASLMNRMDVKFVMTVDTLTQCLQDVQSAYTALVVDDVHRFRYDSLYFDTPDRRFYLDHHNGRLQRWKVRIRHYRDTGGCFLEVKRKTNALRTVKTRQAIEPQSSLDVSGRHFVEEQLGHPATRMLPVLFVSYRRATLMTLDGRERITLDTQLSFCSPDRQARIELPELAVVEAKFGQKARVSPLLQGFRRQGVRPQSFSKYCIGSALVYGRQLKTNRFKPQLRSLHGICR